MTCNLIMDFVNVFSCVFVLSLNILKEEENV